MEANQTSDETCEFDDCDTLAETRENGTQRRVCRHHRRMMQHSGAW